MDHDRECVINIHTMSKVADINVVSSFVYENDEWEVVISVLQWISF